MKNVITTLFVLLACIGANAQTANEWFRQKKTQKKYLIDQIAALKVYTGYLKEGYRIVHGGLSAIENIKNGNFTLDLAFFDSRKNVKPAIRNSIKVANIIGYQLMIIRDFKNLFNTCERDGNFTADEILYLGHVYANLIRSCDMSLADLHNIIQSGSSEMTDDERMKRVDQIHNDMSDKYAFVQSFGNETRQLSLNRGKEKQGIQVAEKLHQNL